MSISERLTGINENLHVGYDYSDSPLLFGSYDEIPQTTRVAGEGIMLESKTVDAIRKTMVAISQYIDGYNLEENCRRLGLDPKYVGDCLSFDKNHAGKMEYGGLDIYINEFGMPKVLELNSRVQAMGLQDARLQYLSINNPEFMLKQFAERALDENWNKIVVLGTRRNPFWRGHKRMADFLSYLGFDAIYADGDYMKELSEKGNFIPDVIFRTVSSKALLYNQDLCFTREMVEKYGITVVNSASATFFGDRGFLMDLSANVPNAMPEQAELTQDSAEDTLLSKLPWIKLDTGKEFSYVVNYNDLRRWGKDCILSLLKHDFSGFDKMVFGKDSGDAYRLKQAKDAILLVEPEQVKWIAQEHVEPNTESILVNGERIDLKLLYRLYWVKSKEGQLNISMEAFGCTKEQFSQSKGKINAGSGIAVPVSI